MSGYQVPALLAAVPGEASPLSQSNWDNRIVVPLDFLPLGQARLIGAPERRVLGHELAAHVVSSWQPALCAATAPPFMHLRTTSSPVAHLSGAAARRKRRAVTPTER